MEDIEYLEEYVEEYPNAMPQLLNNSAIKEILPNDDANYDLLPVDTNVDEFIEEDPLLNAYRNDFKGNTNDDSEKNKKTEFSVTELLNVLSSPSNGEQTKSNKQANYSNELNANSKEPFTNTISSSNNKTDFRAKVVSCETVDTSNIKPYIPGSSAPLNTISKTPSIALASKAPSIFQNRRASSISFGHHVKLNFKKSDSSSPFNKIVASKKSTSQIFGLRDNLKKNPLTLKSSKIKFGSLNEKLAKFKKQNKNTNKPEETSSKNIIPKLAVKTPTSTSSSSDKTNKFLYKSRSMPIVKPIPKSPPKNHPKLIPKLVTTNTVDYEDISDIEEAEEELLSSNDTIHSLSTLTQTHTMDGSEYISDIEETKEDPLSASDNILGLDNDFSQYIVKSTNQNEREKSIIKNTKRFSSYKMPLKTSNDSSSRLSKMSKFSKSTNQIATNDMFDTKTQSSRDSENKMSSKFFSKSMENLAKIYSQISESTTSDKEPSNLEEEEEVLINPKLKEEILNTPKKLMVKIQRTPRVEQAKRIFQKKNIGIKKLFKEDKKLINYDEEESSVSDDLTPTSSPIKKIEKEIERKSSVSPAEPDNKGFTKEPNATTESSLEDSLKMLTSLLQQSELKLGKNSDNEQTSHVITVKRYNSNEKGDETIIINKPKCNPEITKKFDATETFIQPKVYSKLDKTKTAASSAVKNFVLPAKKTFDSRTFSQELEKFIETNRNDPLDIKILQEKVTDPKSEIDINKSLQENDKRLLTKSKAIIEQTTTKSITKKSNESSSHSLKSSNFCEELNVKNIDKRSRSKDSITSHSSRASSRSEVKSPVIEQNRRSKEILESDDDQKIIHSKNEKEKEFDKTKNRFTPSIDFKNKEKSFHKNITDSEMEVRNKKSSNDRRGNLFKEIIEEKDRRRSYSNDSSRNTQNLTSRIDAFKDKASNRKISEKYFEVKRKNTFNERKEITDVKTLHRSESSESLKYRRRRSHSNDSSKSARNLSNRSTSRKDDRNTSDKQRKNTSNERKEIYELKSKHRSESNESLKNSQRRSLSNESFKNTQTSTNRSTSRLDAKDKEKLSNKNTLDKSIEVKSKNTSNERKEIAEVKTKNRSESNESLTNNQRRSLSNESLRNTQTSTNRSTSRLDAKDKEKLSNKNTLDNSIEVKTKNTSNERKEIAEVKTKNRSESNESLTNNQRRSLSNESFRNTQTSTIRSTSRLDAKDKEKLSNKNTLDKSIEVKNKNTSNERKDIAEVKTKNRSESNESLTNNQRRSLSNESFRNTQTSTIRSTSRLDAKDKEKLSNKNTLDKSIEVKNKNTSNERKDIAEVKTKNRSESNESLTNNQRRSLSNESLRNTQTSTNRSTSRLDAKDKEKSSNKNTLDKSIEVKSKSNSNERKEIAEVKPKNRSESNESLRNTQTLTNRSTSRLDAKDKEKLSNKNILDKSIEVKSKNSSNDGKEKQLKEVTELKTQLRTQPNESLKNIQHLTKQGRSVSNESLKNTQNSTNRSTPRIDDKDKEKSSSKNTLDKSIEVKSKNSSNDGKEKQLKQVTEVKTQHGSLSNESNNENLTNKPKGKLSTNDVIATRGNSKLTGSQSKLVEEKKNPSRSKEDSAKTKLETSFEVKSRSLRSKDYIEDKKSKSTSVNEKQTDLNVSIEKNTSKRQNSRTEISIQTKIDLDKSVEIAPPKTPLKSTLRGQNSRPETSVPSKLDLDKSVEIAPTKTPHKSTLRGQNSRPESSLPSKLDLDKSVVIAPTKTPHKSTLRGQNSRPETSLPSKLDLDKSVEIAPTKTPHKSTLRGQNSRPETSLPSKLDLDKSVQIAPPKTPHKLTSKGQNSCLESKLDLDKSVENEPIKPPNKPRPTRFLGKDSVTEENVLLKDVEPTKEVLTTSIENLSKKNLQPKDKNDVTANKTKDIKNVNQDLKSSTIKTRTEDKNTKGRKKRGRKRIIFTVKKGHSNLQTKRPNSNSKNISREKPKKLAANNKGNRIVKQDITIEITTKENTLIDNQTINKSTENNTNVKEPIKENNDKRTTSVTKMSSGNTNINLKRKLNISQDENKSENLTTNNTKKTFKSKEFSVNIQNISIKNREGSSKKPNRHLNLLVSSLSDNFLQPKSTKRQGGKYKSLPDSPFAVPAPPKFKNNLKMEQAAKIIRRRTSNLIQVTRKEYDRQVQENRAKKKEQEDASDKIQLKKFGIRRHIKVIAERVSLKKKKKSKKTTEQVTATVLSDNKKSNEKIIETIPNESLKEKQSIEIPDKKQVNTGPIDKYFKSTQNDKTSEVVTNQTKKMISQPKKLPAVVVTNNENQEKEPVKSNKRSNANKDDDGLNKVDIETKKLKVTPNLEQNIIKEKIIKPKSQTKEIISKDLNTESDSSEATGETRITRGLKRQLPVDNSKNIKKPKIVLEPNNKDVREKDPINLKDQKISEASDKLITPTVNKEIPPVNLLNPIDDKSNENDSIISETIDIHSVTDTTDPGNETDDSQLDFCIQNWFKDNQNISISDDLESAEESSSSAKLLAPSELLQRIPISSSSPLQPLPSASPQVSFTKPSVPVTLPSTSTFIATKQTSITESSASKQLTEVKYLPANIVVETLFMTREEFNRKNMRNIVMPPPPASLTAQIQGIKQSIGLEVSSTRNVNSILEKISNLLETQIQSEAQLLQITQCNKANEETRKNARLNNVKRTKYSPESVLPVLIFLQSYFFNTPGDSLEFKKQVIDMKKISSNNSTTTMNNSPNQDAEKCFSFRKIRLQKPTESPSQLPQTSRQVTKTPILSSVISGQTIKRVAVTATSTSLVDSSTSASYSNLNNQIDNTTEPETILPDSRNCEMIVADAEIKEETADENSS